MDSGFLLQALAFLLAAVISAPLAKRLGLGSVLGYLIAGAVIGPFGLDVLGDPEAAMHAAEFGVIIMLFLIGLELRPALLWSMRTQILGMGGAQVLLSGAALALAAMALGLNAAMAVAIGLTLALSSTAIVMQSLRERGLTTTTAGRATFSVLLFQDLAVIPMLALFPLLATAAAQDGAAAHGHGVFQDAPPWAQAAATVAAVAAVVLAGRFVMRPVFRAIARSRLQEAFTATALLIVVGVTLLMETVSLSPALGAFLAGVVLADSEFRHEIETDIEPFRGLLLSLFFISVGASVDFALLASAPGMIVGLALGLLAIKALVMFAVARAFKRSPVDSLLGALSLAQGGEFAFVLLQLETSLGIIGPEIQRPLILSVALSMAVTPLLMIFGERLAGRMLPRRVEREPEIEADRPSAIIAGFGRVGQTVGRLLLAAGYRVSVLEHDADQVELLRGFGRQVNYGDASRVDMLRRAGAEEASVLVVAIDDRDRAFEIIDNAKKHFPHLKILARAFDRRMVYELRRKNVDDVERETFESSLRLGVKTLRALGVDAHSAERTAKVFRRYDEKLLAEMAELWSGDFAAYQKAVRDRTALFEDLLRQDMENLELRRPDDSWDTESRDRENAGS